MVHVIDRMVQAAICILITKKKWHDRGQEVRNDWKPLCKLDSNGNTTPTAQYPFWVDIRESRDRFGSWLFHGEKGINFDAKIEGWWLSEKTVPMPK